ncbi:MAG: phospholipase D family protein [Rhodocyclaceae bacterium]|nr:phospholipase D family protein [Rhodocyclaceae bacterium]
MAFALLAGTGWAGEILPARGSVEVLFEPGDDTDGAIESVVDGAREQVLVQAYIFTSRPIAQALLRAAGRGVDVQVLADAKTHRRPQRNVLPALIEGGIPVALEGDFPNAHNKVIVVDPGGRHPAVVTGSYNFTWTAEHKNAENVLILRDNPALARRYADNWHRHRQAAEPVGADLKARVAP